MRSSTLFGRTLREAPAEAELVSHRLMLRAGLMRRLAAGIYSYLPLGWRVMRNIEAIIREEMDAIGGQEINMPVVHPAEIWQESGRWYEVGPELARFKDRGGRDLVLGMTHEEVVTDLARREVDSHRQLPFMVYQLQTKFRDEPRPRGGLIRVREFVMKDAYSFHHHQEGLDAYYPQVCRAYINICRRSGLDVVMVASDVGMMGGTGAHEFMLVSEAGEDTLLICSQCGYAANREVAVLGKTPASPVATGELRAVETPGMRDIPGVAAFLGVTPSQTLKTLVFVAGDQLVLACIRGDLEVNERKLANLLKVAETRLAGEAEARSLGLVPGYVSPVGLTGYRIVADDSVPKAGALVAGANREDHHFTGAGYGRDFVAGLVGDIAAARAQDPCASCGNGLEMTRGIEVGNTFKLGVKYSRALKAVYLDAAGQELPVVMGCYGLGVGRLAACIVEKHHDERGIIWPVTVAPYHVYLMTVGDEEEVVLAAQDLYTELQAHGIPVLYDDREVSAGVKFNDADLLGFPVRATVSKRNLRAGAVEVKRRRDTEAFRVPVDSVVDSIEQTLAQEAAAYTVR
ncbi:MAG TPA: proline--tRNA ligase [Clostridiales bacterium UBA8153]|nr:proline--tRNA ligase [Clostridiales bacterium UBA8153]